MNIETNVVFKPADNFASHVEISQISAGITMTENCAVLWGPYIEIPAGSWNVTFFGEFQPGDDGSHCDVCAEEGTVIFGGASLTSGSGAIASISFSTPVTSAYVEFRVFGTVGSHIRIDSIALHRSDSNLSVTALKAISKIGRQFELYKRDGLNLLLDEQSLVDHNLIRYGTWEPEQLRYLKHLTAKCPIDGSRKIFLDIGSYFGLYSLHMLRMNFFDEIIAFEADSLNYRQLQANLLINDPQFQVKTHNIAVSSQDGEDFFFPSWLHPTQNRGGVGLLADGDDREERVRVSTRALDSLLSLAGNTVVAKLDVEGSEIKVLRGMRDILSANRCVLQVEALIGAEHVARNAEVDNFLISSGFRLINGIGADKYFSNFM